MNDTFPKLTPQEAADLRTRQLIGQLMRMVAINAYAAYSNTLVGNAAPAIRQQFERSTKPQPGDVVYERSTIWQWARNADDAPLDQYPGIGVLLREAVEPIATAEQLAAMHAHGDYYVRIDETLGDIPKERVFYIRPLDGSVPEYRWTNADFVRVFDSLDQVRP